MNASNFSAARAFAEFGMVEKAAKRRESASGPGSGLAAAERALDLVRRTILTNDVRSVLDLGCGDWHWMRGLGLPDLGQGLSVSYEGWDASESLINSLSLEYGTDHITFKVRDINSTSLPEVDQIIARDVLFHLESMAATRLLGEIRRWCRLFISTSFLGIRENGNIASYLPIDGWGFYKIYLNIPPFNLAETMVEALQEPFCSHGDNRRFVCLYEFQ